MHGGRGDIDSVEISPCKLSAFNPCSQEGEVAFVDWQQLLAQDSDVGIYWHKEFAEVFPDEGRPLVGACCNYLSVREGKLPSDMTKEEVVANWQDVNKAKVNEIIGLYDFGCVQRHPRVKGHNIIDAR